MKCPKCGADDDKVLDSRSARDGAAIRRRRECVACGHRFTTYEEIDRDEVPADKIAELVMHELHKVDEVAYIRFASVYRQFKDVESFMEELQQILDMRTPNPASNQTPNQEGKQE